MILYSVIYWKQKKKYIAGYDSHLKKKIRAIQVDKQNKHTEIYIL